MFGKVFSFLVLIGTTLCGPGFCSYVDPPSGCYAVQEILAIGDTWEEENVAITFDSFKYEIDESEDNIYMQLTYTINPVDEFELVEDDVYVVNLNYYHYYGIVYSITEKNEEINEFNIFNTSITEETQYTFYFESTLDSYKDENGQLIGNAYRIDCTIFPAFFYYQLELETN